MGFWRIRKALGRSGDWCGEVLGGRSGAQTGVTGRGTMTTAKSFSFQREAGAGRGNRVVSSLLKTFCACPGEGNVGGRGSESHCWGAVPPPKVGHTFLSSLPLATWVFSSASDYCCTQASQLSSQVEVAGGFGDSEGIQLGSIITPLQWPSSFLCCVHPQGPRALPPLPKAAAFTCPRHLSQTPLK